MQEEATTLPVGARIGLFFGVLVLWLAIGFGLHSVLGGFRNGGWGMWPILLVGIVAIMLIADRIRYLYFSASFDRRVFAAHVQKHLLNGDVASAIAYCRTVQQPVARIVAAGLANMHRPDDEVQDAVDEAALYELPRIEKRTGYLAMIGNISTLLGLLGTIIGLIKSFAGVSISDPTKPESIARAKQYVHLVPDCQRLTNGRAIVTCIENNKATILAKGISEAMNCTAFGLAIGIIALLGFSLLNGRTQALLDRISDATVQVMNVAVGNRRIMRVG